MLPGQGAACGEEDAVFFRVCLQGGKTAIHGLLVCVGEQHGKFVAAPTADQALCGEVLPQQRRELDENPVAGLMTVGVVDLLESIEIQHYHGVLAAGAGSLQIPSGAVGQSGERIGAGGIGDGGKQPVHTEEKDEPAGNVQHRKGRKPQQAKRGKQSQRTGACQTGLLRAKHRVKGQTDAQQPHQRAGGSGRPAARQVRKQKKGRSGGADRNCGSDAETFHGISFPIIGIYIFSIGKNGRKIKANCGQIPVFAGKILQIDIRSRII